MKQTSAMEEQTFTHEDISRRAREIWQARGQPSGQDDEIWFEAERSLAEKSQRVTPTSATPPPVEPPKRIAAFGAAAETSGMTASAKPAGTKKRAGKGGR